MHLDCRPAPRPPPPNPLLDQANIPPTTPVEEWPLEGLAAKLKQYCYLLGDLTPEGMAAAAAGGDYEALRTYLRQRGVDAFYTKVAEIEAAEEGLAARLQRYFVLAQTDSLWKEHLQAIKFLQQAVSLRGYAQRDPLVEYKLEGFQLFLEMTACIRRNVVYNFYEVRVGGGGDEGPGAPGPKNKPARLFFPQISSTPLCHLPAGEAGPARGTTVAGAGGSIAAAAAAAVLPESQGQGMSVAAPQRPPPFPRSTHAPSTSATRPAVQFSFFFSATSDFAKYTKD